MNPLDAIIYGLGGFLLVSLWSLAILGIGMRMSDAEWRWFEYGGPRPWWVSPDMAMRSWFAQMSKHWRPLREDLRQRRSGDSERRNTTDAL